jgi:RNA polymerase sigma-70 factor (ECF subfamily)
MDSDSQQDRFVEQFVRSQDRIYAYVVTLLPNRGDAEEVFQQTSLALWKKWQEFDSTRDFLRWACGMAHLEVCNFLRKHAGRSRVDLSEDVLLEVAQVRLDIHDVLEARRQALLDCLGRLKRDSRELLERCYAGKDSIKQIAADLGLRPNVLYMTLKRLRRTLFDCINLHVAAAEGSQ